MDSDDEWEEEEPGESLHGSDDEKDKESDDDYDIDNEFFVPHGHLSDEELMNEDELDEDNNPEIQKAKLKLIQDEFADELKKKTEKLRPRLLGLIWQNSDGSQPSDCSNGIWSLLQTRAFMFSGPCVNLAPKATDAADNSSDDSEGAGKVSAVRRLKITEKEVPDLIRLINGNQNNCNFLIKEFRAHIAKNAPTAREFSIASIRYKIKELAAWKVCPEEGPMHKKMCWYVPVETRKRYDLGDLRFPNAWQYTLTPRRVFDSGDQVEKEKEAEAEREKAKEAARERMKREYRRNSDSDDVLCLSDSNSCGLSESITSETVKQASAKSANFNIAKYIRVLTEEEKKKQFGSLTLRSPSCEQFDSTVGASQSDSPASANGNGKKSKGKTAQPTDKKRVQLLMSVPCGQEVPPKLKSTLVTQFLNNNPRKRKASSDGPSTSVASGSGSAKKKPIASEVIVLDD